MGFDVEGARKEGYSDAEIADHLAQQSGYDVKGARQEGHSDADIISHLSGTPVAVQEQQAPQLNPGELPSGQGSPVGAGLTAATAGAVGEAGVKTAKSKYAGNVVKNIFNPGSVQPPPAVATPPKFMSPEEILKQGTTNRVAKDVGSPPSVVNWMQQQHAGVPVRGRNMKEAERLAQEHLMAAEKKAAFEAANPGKTITGTGIIVNKADADMLDAEIAAMNSKRDAEIRAEAKAAGQTRAARLAEAERLKGKQAFGKNITGGMPARIASYGVAGAEGEAALNNFETGNPVGGALDTIGAGAALAAPHLPGKFGKIATGIAGIAPIAAELVPHKASGGSVQHFLSGGNVLSQAALNSPFIAPSVSTIGKSVAKGAYAPAMEEAADLGLSLAPLNPVTAALSALRPTQMGNATLDEWNRQKAEEAKALEEARRELEMQKFYQKIGRRAPQLFNEYELEKVRSGVAPKFDKGGTVLKEAADLFRRATLSSGKSKAQLLREAGYTHDITPTHNFLPQPVRSIQDIQHQVLVGLPGDKTETAKLIHSVNGVPLSQPVEQEGGRLFGQRQNDLGSPLGWASQEGAAKGFQSRVNEAHEATGMPVVALYNTMDDPASHYAMHYIDTLLNQYPAMDQTKAQMAAFNKMFRQKYPDFPGLGDEDLRNALVANTHMRREFGKAHDVARNVKDFNIPSGEATIHATSDPRLRDIPTGTTGFGIMHAVPGASTVPNAPHGNYDTGIVATAGGELIAKLPWYDYFPNAMKNILAHPNPNQAKSPWGTFKMSKGMYQPVNQELVDKIAPIEEAIKAGNLPSYKEGGLVALKAKK